MSNHASWPNGASGAEVRANIKNSLDNFETILNKVVEKNETNLYRYEVFSLMVNAGVTAFNFPTSYPISKIIDIKFIKSDGSQCIFSYTCGNGPSTIFGSVSSDCDIEGTVKVGVSYIAD